MKSKTRMLVITGLYFNAKGNQSMYNSLKGYSAEYDVTIITAADLKSEQYMSMRQVNNSPFGIVTISVWPSRLINFLRIIIRRTRKAMIGNKIHFSENCDIRLINAPTGLMTVAAFKLRSFLLLMTAIPYMLMRKVDVVCAYEVNALKPSAWLSKIFKNVTYVGKFQGTVMGGLHDECMFYVNAKKTYPLESWSMPAARLLDGAIMTNDGTSGDVVLRKYGLSDINIRFIPNGVDDRVLAFREKLKIQSKSNLPTQGSILKVASISRLIGWKRVPDVISAVDHAITKGAKIQHVIIGGGSESEVATVMDRIKNTRNPSAFAYLGALGYDETIKKLSEMDLLISAYSVSNICNPVFESLALMVPVLTMNDERLKEIIGIAADACFFVDVPDGSMIAKNLAHELTIIDSVSCVKKRDILFDYEPYSWGRRNADELEFIRVIKKRKLC